MTETERNNLIGLLLERQNETFDGECHLTNEQADDIITALRSVTSASVSEAAVTDEMVEAAQKVFNAWGYSASKPDCLRAALSAALASTAERVEPVGYIGQWSLDELARGNEGNIFPTKRGNALPLYTSPPARRDTWEEALECQPSTAENPNESAYQRGRFDGIMEYSRAIRARATEEREA